MSDYNFGPAADGERFVFGSSRPGYPTRLVPATEVEAWLDAMAQREIRRVVCLLDETQLTYYGPPAEGLIGRYREFFGAERVLHAPVKDFGLATAGTFAEVLPFLDDAVTEDERVIVHCSMGSGRTGQVLSAWVAHSRGLHPADALDAVAKIPYIARDPLEVVHAGRATIEALHGLLDGVRRGTSGAAAGASP